MQSETHDLEHILNQGRRDIWGLVTIERRTGWKLYIATSGYGQVH